MDTERIEVTPGPGNEVITQTEEDDVAENLASLDIEEAITEESAVPSTSITVDVGGKQIHKSSVIREMFESSKASNDGLRRVRGYSKIVELTEDVTGGNEVDLDDCIMLGAAKIKNRADLASFGLLKIKSIKDNVTNKFETVISGISVGNKTFNGEILEGKLRNDKLCVNECKNNKEEITIDGTYAVYVKMQESMLRTSEVKTLMEHLPIQDGKNFKLLPYHSTLTETCDISDTSQKKVDCKICKKKISRKKMREHIGAHIVKDEIEKSQSLCGYCGTKNCDITITRGSGRGKTASEIPISICEYFEKFSLKSAKKVTKTNQSVYKSPY